jgi:transposase
VRFRHRMLPRALAGAAHDEQVAVCHFVADRRAAAARPQRQRARRADRNDRDHGVLSGAATDRVAVPGDAVAAVAVVAQTGGADLLSGDLVATIPAARRFDLTDGQWAVLEPLLPPDCGWGRPLKWSKRQLIDGIRWRTRVGCPWRDAPGWYGSWQRIYGLSGSGNGIGIWAAVISRLQAAADASGLIAWDVSVDSTTARAHQHAAGARRDGAAQREPPGGVDDEPPDCRKPLVMRLTAG